MHWAPAFTIICAVSSKIWSKVIVQATLFSKNVSVAQKTILYSYVHVRTPGGCFVIMVNLQQYIVYISPKRQFLDSPLITILIF